MRRILGSLWQSMSKCMIGTNFINVDLIDFLRFNQKLYVFSVRFILYFLYTIQLELYFILRYIKNEIIILREQTEWQMHKNKCIGFGLLIVDYCIP